MEKNSEATDKNIFGDAFPRARTTCGEILPDGTIIDLVMSKEEERLHLIHPAHPL